MQSSPVMVLMDLTMNYSKSSFSSRAEMTTYLGICLRLA